MDRPTVTSLPRRLVSDSAIYGLGGVANQALAVILVPIYANVLGVANYGTVALVNTTLSLATVIVTLALPQAFFRSYLMEHADERGRAWVLRTTLGLRLVTSLAGLAALVLLAVPLTNLLFGDMAQLPILIVIGPIVFCDTLNLVPLSFLRAERRPAAYAALSLSRAVLGSLVIIIFVVVLHMGIFGVVLGSLISASVVALAGVVVLARAHRIGLALDRPLVNRMLAFSLPLVPAAVAGWMLNLSDRYLVQAFDGSQAVGIYSAGYSVGLVINALAVAPFSLAWGATFWEIATTPSARQTYARVMTGFVIFAAFIALGLSALGTDVLRLLFQPDFEPSRFVVPFSAFAYVLYGTYSIGATGLNIEGRTRVLPLTLGAVAIGNVALNLVLIPSVGYIGAAVSTLLSYGLLALSTTVVSQRYYPVPWDLPRVVGALTLAMSLAATALLGPDHIAWRLGCIAAYPVLVVLLRIVRKNDLVLLWAALPGGRGSRQKASR
jgi:O-antigen/teichoic acid export membrane protein